MENTAAYNETQISYLLQLQVLDKKLDTIEDQRGSLPQMVNDLKEKIADINMKNSNTAVRIEEHNKAIAEQEGNIKASRQKVKRQEKEQKEAKNDQEYKLITKDLELERLDILLAQKKIKEHQNTIAREEIKIEELVENLEKQEIILVEKKKTLVEIDTANETRRIDLEKKRIKVLKKIDVHFFGLYAERRENDMPDVVVNIVNEACNGCFIEVPTQIQLQVKGHEKVVFCENCSRLFAYIEEPVIEIKLKKRTLRRRVKATSSI